MCRKLMPLVLLMLTQSAFAQPGPFIERMIKTPASAFDLFLFRLYEAGKCNTVVKNGNLEEADLCLSSIQYDADKNILTAFFRVLPGAEAMDDFVDLEKSGRREILLQLLQNTARRVGAVDGWGLLHSIPLGYGGDIAAADEKSFRSELAGRTTTKLSTSYDGVVYVATRHHDGRIEYFTSK